MMLLSRTENVFATVVMEVLLRGSYGYLLFCTMFTFGFTDAEVTVPCRFREGVFD